MSAKFEGYFTLYINLLYIVQNPSTHKIKYPLFRVICQAHYRFSFIGLKL